MSFADKAIQFYQEVHLDPPPIDDVQILDPYANEQAMTVVREFYGRFYSDSHARVGIFGINPGRFGGGITGISFTDPVALQNACGIENSFEKRQELSSTFVYQTIEAYGGAETFFSQFYLSALCPLGFTRKAKNYNFYDDPTLLRHCEGFVIQCMESQLNFPLRRDIALCLGRGHLQKIFTTLNNKHGFFNEIVALDHPRFVMQYRRSTLQTFVSLYNHHYSRAASLPATL